MGLFKPGKASHSMRHSFDTELVNNDIPYIRVKELMGHSLDNEGESASRYYKGAKLWKLCDAVNSIDYGIKIEKKNGEWQICKDKNLSNR